MASDRSNGSRVDALFDGLAQSGTFSGVVLLRRGGETLRELCLGYADQAGTRPNTAATAFQIASVSKQFTAAAILLLQERRQLSVHDRIADWLEGCPPAWQPITIHHLLTHTSGIGHWYDFPGLDLFHLASRSQLIDTFSARPLRFRPGAGWCYSSPAYVLLARIAERCSAEPYAVFLRRHIFQPLAMDRSGAGSTAPYPEGQASGLAGGSPVPSLDLDTVAIGAGDLWSTAGDLARWNDALLNGGLLAAPSLAAMFAPYAEVPEAEAGAPGVQYGYGWFVAGVNGHTIGYHPGGNSGFRACNALVLRPACADSVIVLANDERSDAQAFGRQLVLALAETEPSDSANPDRPR